MTTGRISVPRTGGRSRPATSHTPTSSRSNRLASRWCRCDATTNSGVSAPWSWPTPPDDTTPHDLLHAGHLGLLGRRSRSSGHPWRTRRRHRHPWRRHPRPNRVDTLRTHGCRTHRHRPADRERAPLGTAHHQSIPANGTGPRSRSSTLTGRTPWRATSTPHSQPHAPSAHRRPSPLSCATLPVGGTSPIHPTSIGGSLKSMR